MNYFLLLTLPIFIHFINFFIKKNNLIPNYYGEKHQKFIGKNNIPLSGGFFLVTTIIFIFYNDFILFSSFVFLIFIIGLVSDVNFLSSPRLRFFLQTIVIFLFVYLSKLHIGETRIYFLDFILDNILLSYFFTTFCLMIVINGSNFIDGLNGLTLGYYLMILVIIFKLNLLENIYVNESKIIFLLFLIGFLFLFNIFNQLYVGDSGAYLLGFITSFFLISIHQINQNISPFYIVLLLWYPCFENLYSIIRKFRLKRSPIMPDNNHLHQLLFLFIKKKNSYGNNVSNNLASFIILFYNLIIFILASIDIYNTQYQIFLIFFNIMIYTIFYLRLFTFRYNIKNK